MTLIALVLIVIALASGMSADAFIDATGEALGPILFTVAFFLAILGDIKRAL